MTPINDFLDGLDIIFDGCEEFDMSKLETVALYSLYQGFNGKKDKEIIRSLIRRKLVKEIQIKCKKFKYDSPVIITEYYLTYTGKIMLKNIISKANKIPDHLQDRLLYLSTELKEVFPKGRKEGTSYQWRGSTPLIMKRLNMFFHKYGENYSDESIINAAKKYVESFNGDYKYMRILKYFIYKEGIGADGEVDSTSDLLEYIENEGQEDLVRDWASDLKLLLWAI